MLIPFKSPTLLRWLYPSLTWHRKTDENVVYLTFDDGPTDEVTDWVLDQLAQHNQKATFFCIGANVQREPEVLDRVVNAGHKLGNHTQHHRNGWKTSLKEYIKDVEDCAKEFDSNLFRPPYGRITKRQINALKDQYEIVEWSIISKDYFSGLNCEKAIKALEKHTKPGSVIVFHDSHKAFRNLKKILPEYLRYLEKQGYRSEVL